MLRYLADENFHGDITRGLRLRQNSLDIIRVQDTEIAGAEDSTVLTWAAQSRRIVLTHDRTTMPYFARERLVSGDQLSGLFVVNDRMQVGQAIDELLLLAEFTDADEWANVVLYLPL
jgi:hypothetical protein